MNFIHEGFFCRHIFYVFNIKEIDIIPSKYILWRWRKDIIATEALVQKFSNTGEEGKLVKDAFAIFISIVNKLGREKNGLKNFISNLEDMHEVLNERGKSKASYNKESRMASLRGASVPEHIEIQNPEGIRNKGTGKRLISNRDKSIAALKKRKRDCALCHKPYHDARTCHLRNKDK
ncbi:hypothetical protein LXL04_023293 [Taraxacum kok-saghyz]